MGGSAKELNDLILLFFILFDQSCYCGRKETKVEVKTETMKAQNGKKEKANAKEDLV
ncbi:hypothetical protein MTR_1g019080 [Medicago truncatula]|uniref:Transmembrane protein n=1 Tax=Medicago truncatula TaxID=3880 RepID=G7I2D6_MEDTR|nr:hypothetical protein MTR_1g019080 [Medicago truncatula]